MKQQKTVNKLEEHLMKHSRKRTLPIRRLCIAQLENSMNMEVSATDIKETQKGIQRTENNIAIVQRAITENPTTSVRRNETNLSKSTFHRILKKDIRLHPYKMQIQHELLPFCFLEVLIYCSILHFPHATPLSVFKN
ncbi:hypothetical protein FHG87_024754 [Trinorchestia longiramus]|nr:hypothetical protein FHG87_024754 [Trinorchestia longiramus]